MFYWWPLCLHSIDAVLDLLIEIFKTTATLQLQRITNCGKYFSVKWKTAIDVFQFRSQWINLIKYFVVLHLHLYVKIFRSTTTHVHFLYSLILSRVIFVDSLDFKNSFVETDFTLFFPRIIIFVIILIFVQLSLNSKCFFLFLQQLLFLQSNNLFWCRNTLKQIFQKFWIKQICPLFKLFFVLTFLLNHRLADLINFLEQI